MPTVIPKLRKWVMPNALWNLIYGKCNNPTGENIRTHFTPEVIPCVFPVATVPSRFPKKDIPSVFPKEEKDGCSND